MHSSEMELFLVCLEPILQFSEFREIQQMQSSSRCLSRDAKNHLKIRCRSVLKGLPHAAQMHYRQLFDCDDCDDCSDSSDSSAFRILLRRQLLIDVDEATQFGQWRTQTAVARLMTGVSLDGTDVFAAVKRAFLASQVVSLSRKKDVVSWMHVLGALEEQDPLQAKRLAAEAWEALAGHVFDELDEHDRNDAALRLEGQNDATVATVGEALPPLPLPSLLLLWLQTVHFVNALDDQPDLWLRSDSCSACSAGQLYRWLQILEKQLELSPTLGRYGPSGDSSQLRSRHVARIHERMRDLI